MGPRAAAPSPAFHPLWIPASASSTVSSRPPQSTSLSPPPPTPLTTSTEWPGERPRCHCLRRQSLQARGFNSEDTSARKPPRASLWTCNEGNEGARRPAWHHTHLRRMIVDAQSDAHAAWGGKWPACYVPATPTQPAIHAKPACRARPSYNYIHVTAQGDGPVRSCRPPSGLHAAHMGIRRHEDALPAAAGARLRHSPRSVTPFSPCRCGLVTVVQGGPIRSRRSSGLEKQPHCPDFCGPARNCTRTRNGR